MRLSLLLATTALTSPLFVAAAAAQSLPTGGSVAAGSAAISQPNATNLNITQSSQSAVVNFQSYSVGPGSSVNYSQPNAASAILNRVTGSAPSSIAGSINANGQVYLVNPNGIAITKSGTVNTGGGFVASTLGISDSDFMSGKRTFTGNGASAGVSNAGTITVGRGGYAALIGGTVSNAGSINVPLGKVGLGSGERATLDFSGDGFLQVAVPTASGGKGALIKNSGSIKANGGSVTISAATAREAARNAINISGTVQARSIGGHSGAIIIGGGGGGRVRITGTLDASSRRQTGGTIAVTGKDIKLKGATVDASGKIGGGTINIGGGRQGQGPLQRADTTTIDKATTIKADATQSGNGGNVTVWSDQHTDFAGRISATGGALGGNGGEAEVSGKATLSYTGFTDLSAAKGSFGTLLLDPYNVIISNGADYNQTGFTATGNDSVINATTLSTQLGSANVTVSTGSGGSQDGNITVAAPVVWSAPTTLTLTAANAIAINSTISVQGVNGGVALNMANDTTTFAGVSIPKLSFGTGASIDYGATNQGATLSINSQPYTLLYSMSDVANVNNALGDRYAVATTIDVSASIATPYTTSVVGTFTGTFEGLGNRISNLTIASTTQNDYVGLFSNLTGGGSIRNFSLVGGSISGSGNGSSVGGVIGRLAGGSTIGGPSGVASMVNVASSATVSGSGDSSLVGGLVGWITTYGARALVMNSSATGSVSGGNGGHVGGLVGFYTTSNGGDAAIIGSHATGKVTGSSSNSSGSVGGLVGLDQPFGTGLTTSIVNSYATGDVVAPGVYAAGGLVGYYNVSFGATGTISGSYATGAVQGAANSNGGLVGHIEANSSSSVSITDSYAMGAVIRPGDYAYLGGFVGFIGTDSSSTVSISNAYSTGAVSPTVSQYYPSGSFAGTIYGNVTFSNAYWNNQTSGISAAIGGDSANVPQSGNVSGQSTAQLQGALPAGFSSSVWGTGTDLYPYQKAIFPGGVQAVSGFAYTDIGTTPLASGANGAAVVTVLANGARFAAATTGANGYYYAFGAAGSIAAGQSLLAYTSANAQTGATNAATHIPASGTAAQTGTTIYGNTLTGTVSDTTLTAASTSIVTNAIAAAGGDSAAQNAIYGTSDRYYIATGSSFTINGSGVSTNGLFGARTTASDAPITVAAPIAIGSTGRLILNAAGALAVNAPVTVNGAVSVALTYNTSDPANLSFAIGAPLTFTAGSGGSLTINGDAYTLISDINALQNINSSDSFLGGRLALANNIDASATAGWIGGFIPLGTNGTAVTDNSNLLNNGFGFSGIFTGLGHTIDKLTIDRPGTGYVGLFGSVWYGAQVRNVGLTNASVAGTLYVGSLAGINYGVVTQSYASGQVQGPPVGYTGYTDSIGGLVGSNDGAATLSNSFSTASLNAPVSNSVGGAVGINRGLIDAVYATGAVEGFVSVGGLVGTNLSTFSLPATGGIVTNSYATGAVRSTYNVNVNLGSLVGDNPSRNLVSGFYDTQTGTAPAFAPVFGSGTNTNVTGLTTASFQNGGASTLGAAYGGGTGGLYPYLKSFFPNGVQAISGYSYADAVGTPTATRTIGVFGGGAPFTTVSTGANGYYYAFGAAGSVATGQSLLVHNSVNAATLTNVAGVPVTGAGSSTLQAGVNLYGNAITVNTAQASLAGAPNLVTAQGYALDAANYDATAATAINAAGGRGFIASGLFGFTIDQPVSGPNTFFVKTTAANAPITVSQAITIGSGGSLGLLASGALAINATITVQGAGGVALEYNTASPTNLVFGDRATIDYGTTNNGGTLAINGQSYGLLYSMSDIAGIYHSAGQFALATSLTPNSSYSNAVVPNFSGTFEGLGHTITNLTITGGAYVGLFGQLSGTARDIGLVDGRITSFAAGTTGGALAGLVTSTGSVANAWASTTVYATATAGGLIGNLDGGQLVNSYATGLVYGFSGTSTAGGLVGIAGNATVRDVFATGLTFGSRVGGLIGDANGGTVTNVYATGYVNGSEVGGLFGRHSTTLTNGFFDANTSGATAFGVVSGGTGAATSLTTAQFQSGSASALGSAFAGGANGIYPYLNSFFPGGVRAVSGYVYQDAGLNVLPGATVGVIADGSPFGTAISGINGYYYAFNAASSASNGSSLLVYTQSGPAATLTTFDANAARSNVNFYGNAITVETMATSLSAAPSLATAKTSAIAAAGGNGDAIGAINGALGRGFIVTSGSSFDIDQAVDMSGTFLTSGTFYVRTTGPGAAITVNAPITSGYGGLGLIATGALAINAPITVQGTGSANLAYDTSSPTNLSFGLTGSGFTGGLTFAKADGTAANSAVAGQALAINGTPYTLLYNMSDVANVNNNLAGNYALAHSLDAGTASFSTAVISGCTPGCGTPNSFDGTFEGLGHTISNLTITGNSNYVGLVGYNRGTIRDVGVVGGSISGGAFVGGLVGDNQGWVVQSYATGRVTADTNAGGLAGNNGYNSWIARSYATGAVSALSYAGGLVGSNNSTTAQITESFATGAVYATSYLGGLIGYNFGSISDSYATGAVAYGSYMGGLVGFNYGPLSRVYSTGSVAPRAGQSYVGGLVGGNFGGGGIYTGYWDTQTSGQASGIGADFSGQPVSVTGSNTSDFQSGFANAGLGGAFAGGTNGLYPYLSSFFPNGVQAVSGFVYSDAGATPLASGANGAVTVGVVGNGTLLGTATTGANGYYYAFGAAGTLSTATNGLLVYSNANPSTGAKNAATLTTADPVLKTGVNIYGDALTVGTQANYLSLAPSLANAKTAATPVAGNNANALAAINGAQGRGLNAASEFFIDQDVTTANTFFVQTPASNTGITVSNAITINSGGSLGLLSAGALDINAPISINGAVGVNLAYSTGLETNFSFGLQGDGFSGSLTFNKADGSAATSAVAGQALAINGGSYSLLYNISQVQGINANLSGNHALARNIDATGYAGFTPIGRNSPYFTGSFTGLGHTISNLTINSTGQYVGLFGWLNTGARVRHVGLVGGSVTAAASASVGAIAGRMDGSVLFESYSSSPVTAGNNSNVGGLVGQLSGQVIRSFATGSVTDNFLSYIGGLVGTTPAGTITDSYATGAVIAGANSYAGGLVGNLFAGGVERSYATGAVTGGTSSSVGGLIGSSEFGGVSQSYATGAVSAVSGNVGGLAGRTGSLVAIIQSYWDTDTSGRANAIGQDGGGQSGFITGLTTAQLQGTASLPNGLTFDLGSAFAGGAAGSTANAPLSAGLYPYLASFAPYGVQAVTGTAYSDAGLTPLASNASSAVTIGVNADGAHIGSATTGANGYYYVATALPAFLTPAINNGQNLLAFTASGAPAAATLTTASGSYLQTGTNLYGNALTVDTSATLFSQGPRTASEARTQNATALASAAGNDTAAQAAIANAVGLGLFASGGSFTIDQTPTINGVLAIQTCYCSPIIVNAPITVASGQSLGLLSEGALTINKPINVNGAASLVLSYDDYSPANFTLRPGTTVSFNDANGAATSTAVAGQKLAINSQRYTLLYSMADVEGIAGNVAAGGTGGLYALANNLTATASYTDALVSSFSGVFEGFNNSITGLTIDAAGNAGLIGQNNGVIRDIAVVGGTINTSATILTQGDAGGLVGYNTGTIFNASSSANVSGGGSLGGLVGRNSGIIANAYATGTVIDPVLGFTTGIAGGLVGSNDAGTITNSYATGAVSGSFSAGGLVGLLSYGSALTNVYATGAVSGGSYAGGLVGLGAASWVSNAYATGAALSVFGSAGGLVGFSTGGTAAAGYYDSGTTGQASGGGGLARTTAQLQGALPSGFDSAIWGTGPGLYPYLKALMPDGVQVVSGTAYKNGGVTPLASTINGLGTVSIASNGGVVGNVNTGANGYYYYFTSAGSLSNANGVAAYTVADVTTGAANAISYASGTPGTVTSLDISGGWRRDVAAVATTSLSALENGFNATVASTPAAAFTLAKREIAAKGAFAIDAALSATDTLSLRTAGALTQTAAITAPKLLVTGTGTATLTQPNQTGTLASTVASLDFVNAANLTIGSVTGADGVAASGVMATGAVKVATSGNLTLASAAPVNGASPVLAAAGAFINNAGANAVTATLGRWLIYSADPSLDTFGGLNSNNTAVWGTAAGGAVQVAGNRYVFAKQQTLTFTSTDATSTQGQDATAALADKFTVSGYASGVTGVYLADTATTAFSGAPSVTSSGTTTGATVAGSPYNIAIAKGTLSSPSGYSFRFVGAGQLEVKPGATVDPSTLASIVAHSQFYPINLPDDAAPISGAPPAITALGTGVFYADPRFDNIYVCFVGVAGGSCFAAR